MRFSGAAASKRAREGEWEARAVRIACDDFRQSCVALKLSRDGQGADQATSDGSTKHALTLTA